MAMSDWELTWFKGPTAESHDNFLQNGLCSKICIHITEQDWQFINGPTIHCHMQVSLNQA